MHRLTFVGIFLTLVVPPLTAQEPKIIAKSYVEAVRKANEDHARKPGTTQEAELGKRLPRQAASAAAALQKLKDSPELPEALRACGEAALDLDLLEDFEQIRARLEKVSPERAQHLGVALSRPRFVPRGLGGLDLVCLKSCATVLDAILSAYDEVFGFKEWSKLPGKKLRVRVHLEPILSPKFIGLLTSPRSICFIQRSTSPSSTGKSFPRQPRRANSFSTGSATSLGT